MGEASRRQPIASAGVAEAEQVVLLPPLGEVPVDGLLLLVPLELPPEGADAPVPLPGASGTEGVGAFGGSGREGSPAEAPIGPLDAVADPEPEDDDPPAPSLPGPAPPPRPAGASGMGNSERVGGSGKTGSCTPPAFCTAVLPDLGVAAAGDGVTASVAMVDRMASDVSVAEPVPGPANVVRAVAESTEPLAPPLPVPPPAPLPLSSIPGVAKASAASSASVLAIVGKAFTFLVSSVSSAGVTVAAVLARVGASGTGSSAGVKLGAESVSFFRPEGDADPDNPLAVASCELDPVPDPPLASPLLVPVEPSCIELESPDSDPAPACSPPPTPPTSFASV